jgi:hypothetical protein
LFVVDVLEWENGVGGLGGMWMDLLVRTEETDDEKTADLKILL